MDALTAAPAGNKSFRLVEEVFNHTNNIRLKPDFSRHHKELVEGWVIAAAVGVLHHY